MEGQRGHVIVVGGGIGGLASALVLARGGHRVTLLERDIVATSHNADEAFFAERRGAPQVLQTHAFLARTVVTLRERLPDVLDDLFAAGATTPPRNPRLGDPEPGDDDLAMLIVRRTTYEWVLRTAVLAEPNADVRMDVGVEHLVATSTNGSANAVPIVTGVVLDNGTTVSGEAVVVATGRRGALPDWLGAIGVEIPETIHESELMYLTRWYRRPPGSPPVAELRGVDNGFVKYLAVPGDADTLSITLAFQPDDAELRKALSDPDRFDAACRVLPGPAQFFEEHLEPIMAVRPMGGLINRLRRFCSDDGQPLVVGLHAVGDAHTCTNPIYGRGCSLALVQATLLADAFAAHPDDHVARARTFEEGSARELEPWFHMSVQWDDGAKAAAAERVQRAESDRRIATPIEALFVAAENEPVLTRGLGRLFNLLVTPEQLFAEPAFTAKAMDVMTNSGDYPLPDRAGPTREELLTMLAAAETRSP